MFSSLITVTPPAEEPISVDLARRHCRIDTDDEDDLLEIYISSARSWAETYLARALVTQQLQWVVAREMPHRSMPYVNMPLSLMVFPLWYPWAALHQHALELPRQPVVSVDAVASGHWGQPDVALTVAEDYEADPATGRLRIHRGWQDYGHDHLAVTFTAGTAASAVLKPVTNAILLLTAFLYENRGDAGGEMPPAAQALLSPFRLITFGG